MILMHLQSVVFSWFLYYFSLPATPPTKKSKAQNSFFNKLPDTLAIAQTQVLPSLQAKRYSELKSDIFEAQEHLSSGRHL